jgi:dihydrodipicolinate synthase/N-acetylneuraminate lyase
MKEALVLPRRIRRTVVRPPLQPVSSAEREQIRIALTQARLLQAAGSRGPDHAHSRPIGG